jgi:O-antigen/teichoic acid export membrane protein
MQLYHIAALSKFVLWVLILIVDYTSINVYEDPTIGIALWFLWLFIAAWGASFYLFLWIQKWYRHVDQLRLIKDSYKLSLLFGIFVILNVLLLLLWYRNKFLWIGLLVWFVALQISLFSDPKTHHDSHFQE